MQEQFYTSIEKNIQIVPLQYSQLFNQSFILKAPSQKYAICVIIKSF